MAGPLSRDDLAELISVAKDEAPADLILTNARIVNVFNGEIESADVAVKNGRIAGVGNYKHAAPIIDLRGQFLAPGFIDGHVHLESSMLDAGEYARAVVPRGTLAIVTDLHEIANVAGIAGLKYILNNARHLPLDVFLMAPSCVPATHLETSGANLDSGIIRRILKWKNCIGLGEMMNYPGVLFGDDAVLDKLAAAQDRVIDGHAPGITGKKLNAYIATGIYSDHESVKLGEAREKLARGMWIMIREGSSEKNLEALLPLITDKTYRRCLFVVDDRTCVDLLQDGDIDSIVRKAIRLGLDPVRAIQLATINPAEYFQLAGLGAIAPGYYANMIVFDNFNDLRVSQAFFRGKLVAADGKALFNSGKKHYGQMGDTINVGELTIESLRFNRPAPLPVIELIPGQIFTRQRLEIPRVVDGSITSDVERDILKLVVVERHHATGNIGLGLIAGFGLKEGALASSVSHDSHNIIAVGADDESLLTALREVKKLGGGLVAANGQRLLAALPLPIAGLLSGVSLEITVARLVALEQTAAGLGCSLNSPYSLLSFMALPVIPELRLTDLGLVDVNEFKIV